MSKIYTIDEIREKVRPVAEKYDIDEVWLFGSYARGEATENSDVDLLVKYKAGMGLKFLRFEDDLRESLGLSMDLLTDDSIYHPLVRDKFKSLIENIEKDEVRLV